MIVETDGWAAHGHRRAFERDRDRDAHLVALGYVILRVTWRQSRDEPVLVAARGVSAGGWDQRVVQAGANRGSFTASFRIRRATVFVAQFAGDSGRTGAGSRTVTVQVARRGR